MVMSMQVVETRDLMTPIAHFSHAARIGNLILIGATAGTNARRELQGDIVGVTNTAIQTSQMFDNLDVVLNRLGAAWQDLVQIKSYLVDFRDAAGFHNEAAKRFVTDPIAHGLAASWLFPLPQAMVELDAIAIVGETKQRWPMPFLGQGAAGSPTLALFCDGRLFVTIGPKAADGSLASTAHGQAQQLIINLQRCLAEAGLARKDIVRFHITLSDPRHFDALDDALSGILVRPFPARTSVAAQIECPQSLFQIELVAAKGGGEAVDFDGHDLANASPAMVVGDTLYSSGFSAPNGGSAQDQAIAAWDLLERTVDEAGFPQGSVLRTNNVLTHWLDFGAFNAAYGPRVRWPYPPRTTVLGHLARATAKVQVEGMAHRLAENAQILQVPQEA